MIADNWALARASSPMHQRWKGQIVTPALITYVQRWLRLRLGVEAVLVIERIGERNRVALRFLDGDHIYEAEVSVLNALRKRTALAPSEQILVLFQRTVCATAL